MLEENKALRMRLHSLTIFRGLLEDPVVSRLAALCTHSPRTRKPVRMPIAPLPPHCTKGAETSAPIY